MITGIKFRILSITGFGCHFSKHIYPLLLSTIFFSPFPINLSLVACFQNNVPQLRKFVKVSNNYPSLF